MRYQITQIQPEHDTLVSQIIRAVGTEYGAIGEGFGPSDPEVSAMSQHYLAEEASRYLVATIGGDIVGGSGIAPFNGSRDICELRKLFLLPQSRGLGIGRALTEQCLEFARSQGYQQCYLDTLKSMGSAIGLYEKMGFEHLDAPLDGTIHSGCDVWMLKQL